MDKKFNIKNYTTDIPAYRSISEIEKLLSQFGAEAIMKEFAPDGKVHSLSFKIDGKVFKLPARTEGIRRILYKKVREPRTKEEGEGREKRVYRIAWRIIKDWTHAQLSLIASGQAEPREIFLPYMYDGQRTLYQTYVEGKLLPQKKEDD